jgi:hypothetical protein
MRGSRRASPRCRPRRAARAPLPLRTHAPSDGRPLSKRRRLRPQRLCGRNGRNVCVAATAATAARAPRAGCRARADAARGAGTRRCQRGRRCASTLRARTTGRASPSATPAARRCAPRPAPPPPPWDETCPVSTGEGRDVSSQYGGGTRRVQSVRGEAELTGALCGRAADVAPAPIPPPAPSLFSK